MSNICDGFALNAYTTYKPYDYFSGCLAQMEILRRANTYRPRYQVFPDDFNSPIPAYTTVEYQFKVSSGAYLYGYRFLQLQNNRAAEPVTDLSLQITEVCTGIPLYREFINPSGASFYSASPMNRGYNLIQLFTQPRLFMAPADITIEMCNLGPNSQYCQLVLLFAETCDLIDTGDGPEPQRMLS